MSSVPADHSAIVAEIVAATRGVIGPHDGFVPLHEPEFRGRERDYVLDCVDTGWVSSVGSYVDRIEADLARITGVRRAVATANGTAALHICLLLVGVQPGDEVLIPTLTFVATANAAAYCGATPHFVDSESVSLGIDAAKLGAHLAEIAEVRDDSCFNRVTGARIGALVVMHAFGHPADLDALEKVARRWYVPLVEDAAESLGSSYHGAPTGSRGIVAALSFNGNKLVTTGGGGAILTNDETLGVRAKHLTTTARTAHRWNFVHDETGYNYRMPNLNAALGCAQLERLDDMLTRKRVLAARYAETFTTVSSASFLSQPPETQSNYWLNAIVLAPWAANARDAVLDALNAEGLMARPVWTLMHHLPMYAAAPRADLSIAEDLATRVINLPSSPKLAD
jgi:perosamine synthetase